MTISTTPVVTNYTTASIVQTVVDLYGTAGTAMAVAGVTDYVRLWNTRSPKRSVEYSIGGVNWQLLPAGKSVDFSIDLSANTIMMRLPLGEVVPIDVDIDARTLKAGFFANDDNDILAGGGGGSASFADSLTLGQVNAVIAATVTGTVASTASPAFTGTPTAPTATAGTSTTQVATTAFAATAATNAATAAVATKADLASPALTGTPTVPTAAAGTSTTQVASTAFVRSEITAASNVIERTSVQALGGHRAVVAVGSAGCDYADQTNADHFGKLVGITAGAVAAGMPVQIRISGPIENPGWAFTVNQDVFLTSNGLVSQTEPAAGDFQQIVGYATTATKLWISLCEPIRN